MAAWRVASLVEFASQEARVVVAIDDVRRVVPAVNPSARLSIDAMTVK
jgi:hypothetical protein